MDSQGLGGGPVTNVVEIGGGTQNIMLRFSRGEGSFVLRRGPRYLRSTSNASLRREMRVLAALRNTSVPHPRLIAACSDESVLGSSVFYLMEPIDGFNASVELPPLHADDSNVRHGMGLTVIDALAALSNVDYQAAGLADVGHPEGFLERQVPRWLHELESYSQLDGYPGAGIPGVQRVADWLDRNRPAGSAPGIMHGDFHVANVMFSLWGPSVVAIVDWEMCTVADPLLDLGWLLATWPQQGEDTDVIDSVLARAGGLASHDELVARFAERTGRDVSAMSWYTVLACFKLGILLEGTYARACAGLAPVATGDRLHRHTLRLFDRADALID